MLMLCAKRLPKEPDADRLAAQLCLDVERQLWHTLKPQRKCERLGGLLLLQELLQRTGIDPQGVRVEYAPTGRPFFAALPGDLSLSHSGDWVVCALELGAAARVGVDVERLRGRSSFSMHRIANRFFSEAERQAFAADAGEHRFLQIWTAKEAMVKYSGEGLSGLAAADSAAPKKELMLAHYCLPGAEVTLCHRASVPPPQEIWCSTLLGYKTEGCCI